MRLTEIEPGRFRFVRAASPPARSALPCPAIITDEMPPIEHVDGRTYTSKTRFRAETRAHGLTEVGTEKFKPKIRSTDRADTKLERRHALRRAVDRYRAGDQRR